MGGWVLVFVLYWVMPDGSLAEQRGRATETFSSLAACAAALENLHPAALPRTAPQGARVAAFAASCTPSEPPARAPAPRPRAGAYEA